MKKTHLITTILGITLLSGCNQQASSPTVTTKTPEKTAVVTGSQIVSLCKTLTDQEVSQITGKILVATDDFLTNQTQYLQGCRYKNNNAYSVSIITNKTQPDVITAKEQYNQALDMQKNGEFKTNADIKELTDLGDAAFYWSNKEMIQLNALKQDKWIALTMSLDDNGDTNTTLEKAKKITNLIFEKH